MPDPVQTLRDKAFSARLPGPGPDGPQGPRGFGSVVTLSDAAAAVDAARLERRAEALEDPDTTLIQAVARGIHEGQGHDAALWLQRPSWHREAYRRDALAAINAAAAVLGGTDTA